jgi:hypothetical protein
MVILLGTGSFLGDASEKSGKPLKPTAVTSLLLSIKKLRRVAGILEDFAMKLIHSLA